MKTKRTIIQSTDDQRFELTATHLKQRNAGQRAYSMTREAVRKAFTRMTDNRKETEYFIGRSRNLHFAMAWKTHYDGQIGVGCTGFGGDNAKQLLTWARSRNAAKTTTKKKSTRATAGRKKSLVA